MTEFIKSLTKAAFVLRFSCRLLIPFSCSLILPAFRCRPQLLYGVQPDGSRGTGDQDMGVMHFLLAGESSLSSRGVIWL